MAEVLYKYALDENNNLVCINNYDKKQDTGHSYKCPNCEAIMIAKPGNGGKAPHFAHKNAMECNGETYLHKMAKLVLKNRWEDKTKDFTIKYKQDALCFKKDICPLFEKELCKEETIMSFNLKNAYDECIEEKEKDGFVADLLVTSKKYRDKPIMIEIRVSHECTDKKKASNHKIIEIKINSIEDVISLEHDDIAESDKISFIGSFEKKSKKSVHVNRGYLQHFKLFSRTGKVHFNECTCQNLPHKSANTLFECIISSYAYDMGIPVNIKKICLTKAKECGAVEKLCSNCAMYKNNNWYNRNICIMYKKYNLPMEPEPISALNCPHYIEDASSTSWGVTNDDKDIKNAKIMIIE
jgi:hypothetical protein